MIDYDFVGALEGVHILKGYVPKRADGTIIGKSGVTISTGVDIGQFSSTELRSILGDAIVDKYKLFWYAGLKCEDAVKALKNDPLVIEQVDSETIAELMKHHHLNRLKESWNSKAITDFDSLPDAMQTVLFSLAYNFGSYITKSLPDTAALAIRSVETQNYKPFINWLKVFPSANPELVKRRIQEAEYLERSLAFK